MSIYIKILLENGTSKEYLLEKSIVIGRSSRASVVIEDPKLSGVHCSIKLAENGSVHFKDEGSTNGSFLSGSQITGHIFKIGDLIQVGDCVLSILENKLTPTERNNIGYCNFKEKRAISLSNKNNNAKTAMSIVRPKAKIKEILKTLTNQKKKN